MKMALAVMAVVALWGSCAALPMAQPYTTQIYKQQSTSPGAFIGEGINHIAAALLQDSEKPGNAAFSPLGHSAILAALAEGASGKTRSQMLAALKLPQDSSLTRATYRSVLSRMREKNAVSKPEFRSWFYVYAKSTKIEDPYIAVLRDSYLMEVRDIQAVEEDTPTEFFTDKEDGVAPTTEAAVPVAPTDSAAPAAPAAPVAPAVPTDAAAPAAPAKEEEEIKGEPATPDTPMVPMAPAAPMAEAEMMSKPSEETPAMPAVPAAQDESAAAPVAQVAAMQEATEPIEAVPVKDEAELPKPAEDAGKAEVDAEIPVKEAEAEIPSPANAPAIAPAPADEPAEVPAHAEDSAKVGEAHGEAATIQAEEEAPQALVQPAVEEIAEEASPEDKSSFAKYGKDEKKPTGDKKKDDKKKGRDAPEDANGRQPPSLLTAFNALYYKGAWQVPFDAKFKDDFHVAEGVQKEVTTIRTQGSFRIGDIKELNATAIELPYKGEGGRYSLLVLLPRAQDGLAKLTEALSKYSFRYLAKNLREKQVDVAIPEFEIDCISHPQAVFRKLGMTAMLDKESADFPGISKNQRVYLQDDGMAQLVRFKVDDKQAIANYLSTMSMSTRSGLTVFHANHPFIFYLHDNLDNLTIVVGRVTDPTDRPANSALDEPQAGAQPEVELPTEQE